MSVALSRATIQAPLGRMVIARQITPSGQHCCRRCHARAKLKGTFYFFTALRGRAAGTEREFEGEFTRGSLRPTRAAEGSAALHAGPQSRQFRLRLRLVDERWPVAGKSQWP